MGYQLKENEYYVIKQILKNQKTIVNEFYAVNEESIIKLTRIMAGTVSVYIYNSKSNARIDMTSDLGRLPRELDLYRDTVKVQILFYDGDFHYKKNPDNYKYFVIYSDLDKDLLGRNRENKPFYIVQRFVSDKARYRYLIVKSLIYTYISDEYEKTNNVKKQIIGDVYEKFIGQKYEELGKNVIYHGINKRMNDNGIDLIVNEVDKVIFVQCKNWIGKDYFKINQKDIRAFIGDSFLYMMKNKINKKYAMHYIVSDDYLLTNNAKNFIKENYKYIKYKVIPFENK